MSEGKPARAPHPRGAFFRVHRTTLDRNRSPFMFNCIVDDLDAVLAKLASNGVRIDPKREDCGRFARVYDPDGNEIELWQP
jgi:predicted enzyme related to lactoylglutathione lyase